MTRAGFFGRNIVASGLASVGAALLLVATDAPSAVANAQYGRSDIISGTVMTDKGPVDGTLLSSGASFVFKGIPYAAPPTGDLRWRPPEPRNPWTAWTEVSIPADGVAGKYTICPQAAPNPAFNFAVSEDCLRLNVWAPVYSDHPLPVIFWLHGGGHTAGSGIRARGFFSDGQYFAERVDEPVIVVTVEFRLGALGFLAHPSLDAENGGTSGNYGLLDQVAALHW